MVVPCNPKNAAVQAQDVLSMRAEGAADAEEMIAGALSSLRLLLPLDPSQYCRAQQTICHVLQLGASAVADSQQQEQYQHDAQHCVMELRRRPDCMAMMGSEGRQQTRSGDYDDDDVGY